MKIKVKIIKETDLDQSFVYEMQKAFPVEEENQLLDLEMMKTLVRNPKNMLFIGFVEGEIVAFVYGHDLDRMDKRKEFFIYEVATAEKFHRKGVMTKVFNLMKSELKSKGFENAWVLTNKSNLPAMAFYKSAGGFEPQNDIVLFEFNLGSE